MRTMRAYRLTEWGTAPSLQEVAAPQPAPGQVVVQVAGCGLCHSDLDMMAMPGSVGEALDWQVPFTLGHETAGWVAAVGAGVVAVAEGDAVALASPASCGTCRSCTSGHENRCRSSLVGRGYGRDGGLADQVLVDDVRGVLPLGSLDPTLAGPLTDAAATSHHAVRRVLPRLPDDGTVLVVGVGGLGAVVVQLLGALSGARVVAVDPDPVRRQVARELGAAEVLDGIGREHREALGAALGPEGAHAAVDLVGTDETIASSCRALAPGGVLGVVGAAGGTLRRPWYGSLPRDGEVFTFQGSDLADARAVIELAADGRLRIDTVPFSLDRVEDAYAALRAGSLAGRVVVCP